MFWLDFIRGKYRLFVKYIHIITQIHKHISHTLKFKGIKTNKIKIKITAPTMAQRAL